PRREQRAPHRDGGEREHDGIAKSVPPSGVLTRAATRWRRRSTPRARWLRWNVQRCGELRRGRVAIGRQLLERREHGLFDRGGNGVALRVNRTGPLGHHLRHDRLRGAARKRWIAGEHLV